MDRIAPPGHRLEEAARCLGSRSQHHRTALSRCPGYRKATPLASSRRLELSGVPRCLVAGTDMDAAHSTIRPGPAPYFPLADNSMVSSGAGETISDSGAIAQTGVV